MFFAWVYCRYLLNNIAKNSQISLLLLLVVESSLLHEALASIITDMINYRTKVKNLQFLKLYRAYHENITVLHAVSMKNCHIYIRAVQISSVIIFTRTHGHDVCIVTKKKKKPRRKFLSVSAACERDDPRVQKGYRPRVVLNHFLSRAIRLRAWFRAFTSGARVLWVATTETARNWCAAILLSSSFYILIFITLMNYCVHTRS